jgi:hypothetical protein
MTDIGSIILLAASAVRPFVAGQVTTVETTAAVTGAGAGPSSSEAFSTDYAMSLLAKITHAGADQALTQIQGPLTPES